MFALDQAPTVGSMRLPVRARQPFRAVTADTQERAHDDP